MIIRQDTQSTRRNRKEKSRTVAAAVLGVLLTLFAVLNSQSVRVHFIVSTVSTPLIVVIAICSLIGMLIGWMVSRRYASRQTDLKTAS